MKIIGFPMLFTMLFIFLSPVFVPQLAAQSFVDINLANAQIEKLRLLNQELARVNKELSGEIDNLQKQIPQWKDEIKRLETAVIELLGKIEQLKDAVKGIFDQLVKERTGEALEKAEALLQRIQKRIDSLLNQIKEAERKIEENRKTLDMNDIKAQENLQTLEQLEKSISFTLGKRESLEPVIRDLQNTMSQIESMLPKE